MFPTPRPRPLSATVFAILFTSLPASEPWAGAQVTALQGRASVIDGDTVEIHGERIRLEGIDAPESRQQCRRDGTNWRCGKDAAFALADRVGTAPILCQGKSRDRYRRLIAVCFVRGEDVNEWMVRQGWALAYRRYSTAYVAAEDEARLNRRGVWAGEFRMPWEWRRGAR